MRISGEQSASHTLLPTQRLPASIFRCPSPLNRTFGTTTLGPLGRPLAGCMAPFYATFCNSDSHLRSIVLHSSFPVKQIPLEIQLQCVFKFQIRSIGLGKLLCGRVPLFEPLCTCTYVLGQLAYAKSSSPPYGLNLQRVPGSWRPPYRCRSARTIRQSCCGHVSVDARQRGSKGARYAVGKLRKDLRSTRSEKKFVR